MDRLGGGIFVGRERELGELRGALDEAERGRGSLLLLSGEPGIGKTRLADRACSLAAERGSLVVWGRAWEGAGAPAFWPWVQVIRGVADAATASELSARLGASGALIAQLVPELREKVPSLTVAVTPPDTEQARFQLFDATTRFVKKAAQSRPLVLVLDDLHWADKPSLLLLEFVARELRDARMFVIGTYREVEARHASPIADLLAALVRTGRHLPLRGLGEADVASFIEQTGKAKPEADLVSAIHQATGGNPFFVDEIVRLIAAEGPRRSGGVPIPDTVRAVIRRRLAFLPDESRGLLSLASAVGREFEARLLERASGRTGSEIAESLARASSAGLVTRSPGGVARHAFAHALIRETLYGDLGPADRVTLHRRIGEGLEELHRADPEPHLAELAHHFSEAECDAPRAIGYTTRAGKRAMKLLAFEEAVKHYERAKALHGLAGTSDDASLYDLLMALGSARLGVGSHAAAREAAVAAAGHARRLRDPQRLAFAAVNMKLWSISRPDEVDEEHIRLLEDALAALPEEPTALRARVLAQLGNELFFSADKARTVHLLEEAVRVARATADEGALAEALITWLYVTTSPRSDPAGVAETAREAVRLAEKAGLSQMVSFAYIIIASSFLFAGDKRAFDRELAAFERTVREWRHAGQYMFLINARVLKLTMEGRLDAAEKLLAELQALTDAQSHPTTVVETLILTFGIRSQQGRLDEIIEAIDWWREVPNPFMRAALAAALCQLGREADARAMFELVAAEGFDRVREDSFWLLTMGVLTEACSFLCDTARAATLYEALAPYAGRHAAYDGLLYFGPVTYSLGLLAHTLGRHDDATKHLEQAIKEAGGMEARPYVARAQFACAQTLLARNAAGDRAKAVRLLEQSIATATEIGMKSLLERAQLLHAETIAPEAPAKLPSSTPIESERATQGTVTLMFSDMSGFTEMTERLGDRQAFEVVEAHNAIVRKELQSHGGRELELQGDGFLLVFDAATAAVHCAVAIQRAFAAYSAEHPAQPIGVRIGIHSGEPLRHGNRYFGKAVILVTRVAGQARAGEIVTSSVVRDLGESDRDLRFDAGSEVELKGISGKRRIFRVRWAEGEAAVAHPEAADIRAIQGNVFRREGDYWAVSHEGRSFRLKDTKGLRYLAELLYYPDQGFRALDLAAINGERAVAGARSPGNEEASLSKDLGDAGPLLDAQAKAKYRQRLGDLRDERDEAERFNDPERASRAGEEIDFLTEELARATGLGGRDRKVGSAAERARSNVTIAIKAALKRIKENDAALGHHLALTVKTGSVCTYTSDPRSPISWAR